MWIERLLEQVSAEQYEAMRLVLATLAEIKVSGLESGTGLRRPGAPVPPVQPHLPGARSGRRAGPLHGARLRHAGLRGGHDYGFANRDGTGLHLAADPDHGSMHSAAAYLYVRDADALYTEWSRPGIGGETRPPARPSTGCARGRTPTRTGT